MTWTPAGSRLCQRDVYWRVLSSRLLSSCRCAPSPWPGTPSLDDTHTPPRPHTHIHAHMQICKRHLQHISMISFTLKTHLQHTCINHEYFLFAFFPLFSSNKKSNGRFGALSAAELKYKHKFALYSRYVFNDKMLSKWRVMFPNMFPKSDSEQWNLHTNICSETKLCVSVCTHFHLEGFWSVCRRSCVALFCPLIVFSNRN